MPVIGYRFPFAMIGAKGMSSGEALCAVDKTKVRCLRFGPHVRQACALSPLGWMLSRC